MSVTPGLGRQSRVDSWRPRFSGRTCLIQSDGSVGEMAERSRGHFFAEDLGPVPLLVAYRHP